MLAFFLLGGPGFAANWYVDNAATGANTGSSWTDAWKSFSAVVWGSSGVKAGDTLFISGGTTSKTYSDVWSVGASGTAGSPIRISIDANNPSHNGYVIFDYDYAGDAATFKAITCNRSYITFDGAVGGIPKLVIQNLRNTSSASGCIGLYGGATTGVTIHSLSFTNCNVPIRIITSTGLRIYDCNIQGVRGDAAIGISGSTGSWEANQVYGNTIQLLCNPLGPHGVEFGDGVSVHDNKFISTKTSLITSSQHPAPIVAQGNYEKIYNNEFVNTGDAVFDYDAFANPNVHDVWFYNNVVRSTTTISPYPQYFRLYTSKPPLQSISNVKVLNNTFADNTGYHTVRFNGFGGNPTASGVEIKNNIFVNCGNYRSGMYTILIDPSSGFNTDSFSIDGNVYYSSDSQSYISYQGTSYSASTWVARFEPHGKTNAPAFVSYTPSGSGNDFHLLREDTTVLDAGLNLNSYFASDKDGISRPQGVIWDIGAYEYFQGGAISSNHPPVVSAGSDQTITLPNSVVLAGTASDPDGTAVTVSWTTVSGPAGVTLSAANVLRPTATFSASGVYTFRLAASDGSLSAIDEVVVTVNPQSTTGSTLAFEAESGLISAPFTVTSGYISQTIDSQLSMSTGGRAVYNFSISEAGDYRIKAVVNAPSAAENSFFINVDADPQNPTMIWDVPVTTGFEDRWVSLRGTGTFDNNQFSPMTFSLASGSHQLIVIGREPNAQLDRVSLVRLPWAPKNLRIVSQP